MERNFNMIDELIETLEWMLKDMERKREFGGPSPEFEKATELLDLLKEYQGLFKTLNQYRDVAPKSEKESRLDDGLVELVMMSIAQRGGSLYQDLLKAIEGKAKADGVTLT